MSVDLSFLVVDPREVAQEVRTPIVAWEGEQRTGTETWEGKLTKRATTPQIELRRLLDNGGTAVVRLNIGNAATNSKGKQVRTGIILSSNKSVNLDWNEYYAMRSAIDEGVERLIAAHEEIYQGIARRAQERANKASQGTQPAAGVGAEDGE